MNAHPFILSCSIARAGFPYPLLGLPNLRPLITRHVRPKLPRYRTSSYSSLSIFSSVPTGDAPSFKIAITAVLGLPLALWTYKCLMLVIFQRRIIYMGYLPPGARKEALEPSAIPSGTECKEITVESERGVLCAGIEIQRCSLSTPEVVVLYLQGNAGTPLDRIPIFTTLLNACSEQSHTTSDQGSCPISIVAVAPRSYWKSTSRTATQKGIQLDYANAVRHVLQKYPAAQVVLYGHSIGGSIATCLLATLQEQSAPPQSSIGEINTNPGEDYSRVSGLILENPFASIPEMVRALYRSPWMPYHYLAPLAFDKWDALGAMQSPPPHSVLARLRSHVRVLVSEHDEVVPRAMGENIAQAAGVHENPGHTFGGLTVIRNAMHEDGWQKRQWAAETRRYLNAVRHRARTPKQ